MKRTLVVCVALSVALNLARAASAQTRIYVSGDLFAEITRMSRTTVTPDEIGLSITGPVDGVTAGGGGRIGAFFSPEWSLELGVDLARTISDARTLTVRLPAGLFFPFPPPQYQSRTSARFSATSVLAGYHPPARGRIHTGFRGGISLMHTERVSTTANISSVFTSLGRVPAVPRISVLTTEATTIGNGLTATLAAEAAIEASRHFAVVPELRVHAGGLGGFVLRPGVAARWLW
ncbi:MAG: hypothetical protein DMF95_25780 [Acidobacteria bacterium]|nr:MAG: hypothetical protein DMF95_25780 [Acidobacteriota bacterium]